MKAKIFLGIVLFILFISIPIMGILLCRFIHATDGEQFILFMLGVFIEIGVSIGMFSIFMK